MTILAQVSGRDMGRAFQLYTKSSKGAVAPMFIVVVTGLLLLVLSYLLWVYFRDRRKPLLLFYELCELHHVPRKGQRRLIHLARSHKLPDPAFLFVCPDLVQQIESLEKSAAKGDKELRGIETFFKGFVANVFG